MTRTSLYYLSTPLFAVLDFAWDVPVRVAGLGAPWQRGAYYLVLVLLGVLCRARPRAGPWVGMAESSVNLVLLLLAILLPIWSMPDAVLTGVTPAPVMGGVGLANAFLSGLVLVASFHRSRMAAERGLRPLPRDGL